MNVCRHCQTKTLLWFARSTVCTQCGLESTIGYVPEKVSGTFWNCILVDTYSRLKRFQKLFESVVLCLPSPKDELMLIFLSQFGKCDMDTLLQRIKDSKLQDKRYGSIHLFCKLHVLNYIAPPLPKKYLVLKRRLSALFKEFEFIHNRYFSDRHFLNYRWL